MSPPPGMPAPSPVVPVCTVTGIPSAAAVSKIGYTTRWSGRNPCAVGCSFSPRRPSSRTARSSSATAASPLSGSTDANPTNASGCSTRASGDEVVGDRRQTGVRLRVPREQHPEHVGGAEHVGHLRRRRDAAAWCGSTPRTRARTRRAQSSTYSGVDGWTWTSIAREHGRYASRSRPPRAGSTCGAGSRGCAPRRACRARTPRTSRRRAAPRWPRRPPDRRRRDRGRTRPACACRPRSGCARTSSVVPRRRS